MLNCRLIMCLRSGTWRGRSGRQCVVDLPKVPDGSFGSAMSSSGCRCMTGAQTGSSQQRSDVSSSNGSTLLMSMAAARSK